MFKRLKYALAAFTLFLSATQVSAQDKQPAKTEMKTTVTLEQRLALLEEQAVKMLADIKAIRAEIKDAKPEGSDFRIFRLKNANAIQVSRLLVELLGTNRESKSLRIVADQATNSIIVAGKQADQDIIEALLIRLDEHSVDAAPPKKRNR